MPGPRISYVDPSDGQRPRHDRRIRALRARGHAAAGKPGDPRACAGDLLVVRQHLARRVQERRRRPQHQGAVPHLRLALGAVRVLRQPALDQGGQGRPQGRRLFRPDQFRESRRATTSGRRRRSPMPRRSPGICRPTTNCGRACTSTSASRSWSRSAISSPSPWASSAGCARSNIEHHQILAGTDGSMAPGFETEDALKRSKQAADYWAKIERQTRDAGRRVTTVNATGGVRHSPATRSAARPRASRASASRASASATARSKCSATSTSTSASARSSPSSARPAAARPRCCAASTACCRTMPARSGSATSASTEPIAGVAMVFQHFGLFPWKTVFDNVAYGLRMAGAPQGRDRAQGAGVHQAGRARRLRDRPSPIRCPAACSSAAGWRARSRSSRTCC